VQLRATFKEAQNYVTPVILAVLIPGGIAAMPATRLDGVMLVMPVGNMVLLARDLLLGAVVQGWQVLIVLLSTTLYAVAAVAIAASVFGRESVVFSDVETLRGHFARNMFRPASRPSLSMSVLYVALLFPAVVFLFRLLYRQPAARTLRHCSMRRRSSCRFYSSQFLRSSRGMED